MNTSHISTSINNSTLVLIFAIVCTLPSISIAQPYFSNLIEQLQKAAAAIENKAPNTIPMQDATPTLNTGSAQGQVPPQKTQQSGGAIQPTANTTPAVASASPAVDCITKTTGAAVKPFKYEIRQINLGLSEKEVLCLIPALKEVTKNIGLKFYTYDQTEYRQYGHVLYECTRGCQYEIGGKVSNQISAYFIKGNLQKINFQIYRDEKEIQNGIYFRSNVVKVFSAKYGASQPIQRRHLAQGFPETGWYDSANDEVLVVGSVDEIELKRASYDKSLDNINVAIKNNRFNVTQKEKLDRLKDVSKGL